MSFIAKGGTILGGETSEGLSSSSLLKRITDNGSFESYNWGDEISKRLSTPISKSVWSESGSYRFMSLGSFRQLYVEPFTFTRDRMYKFIVEVQNTITPATSKLSNETLICGIVKGSADADQSELTRTLVEEYLLQQYTNVVALGEMNLNKNDFAYITDSSNGIRKFSGEAQVKSDTVIPNTGAAYFISAIVIPAASLSDITSLQYDIYSEDVQELLATNVPAGSVGYTQINPNYKPDLSRSSYIIQVDDTKYVESETSCNLVLSADEVNKLLDKAMYTIDISITDVPSAMQSLPVTFSQAYYDDTSSLFVNDGPEYSLKERDGSTNVDFSEIENKIITVYFKDDKFILLSTI